MLPTPMTLSDLEGHFSLKPF